MGGIPSPAWSPEPIFSSRFRIWCEIPHTRRNRPGRSLERAGLVEARYRPVMRRDAIAEVEEDLVDIAPAPAFRRIVALDDRMAGRVEMLGGVAVGRLVAAADMAAGAAEPQMHPFRTRSSGIPRSRARSASRRGRSPHACIRRPSGPPLERGLRGMSAGLREIGVQRRDHLRAFADRGGDALDRAGADVADGEDAAAVGLQRVASAPISAPVRTKPLASSVTSDCASQSVLGSAPMNRKRWRIGCVISSPLRGCASAPLRDCRRRLPAP